MIKYQFSSLGGKESSNENLWKGLKVEIHLKSSYFSIVCQLKCRFKCYLKIIHILHPHYHLKMIWHVLQNTQKSKCICIHEIIQLIIITMKMKMKNTSHRCDILRPRSRHGRKYSKYKNCLVMMMLLCIKQYLSNIWDSMHEEVKQHWGWVGKKRCLLKRALKSLHGGTWATTMRPVSIESTFLSFDLI